MIKEDVPDRKPIALVANITATVLNEGGAAFWAKTLRLIVIMVYDRANQGSRDFAQLERT